MRDIDVSAEPITTEPISAVDFRDQAVKLAELSKNSARPFTIAAGCNGCGGCCDPITLSNSREGLKESKPEDFVHPQMREWALSALVELPREIGIERAAAYGRSVEGWEHFYECRHYDRETRRCGIYETRPYICSGYPWYNEPPDPRKKLPDPCSYIEDIPVELRRRP